MDHLGYGSVQISQFQLLKELQRSCRQWAAGLGGGCMSDTSGGQPQSAWTPSDVSVRINTEQGG